MHVQILRSSLLGVAALALVAATAAAGEPAQKRPQPKGSPVAARSVAPGEMKKFHITASEGKIAPDTLHVRRGERVRVTFVSKDGSYGIKFPDFDAKGKATPESPAVVEFVPTQKGTFEFRCTRTWGFKHWSKNGTLIVE
jgi:cytochrome c oxidase subunit II